MTARICTPDCVCEVDEDTYDWFLECLPPKWMSGSCFAFAEGAEAIRLFWVRDGRFFARQLTWEETPSREVWGVFEGIWQAAKQDSLQVLE